MKLSIPNLSLVVFIGPSGSGKTTFARQHFLPTEVLSSDACRGMVGDNENDQSVTREAFALLNYIAAQRLALGRLTVIDATNLVPEDRKPYVELARKYHCLPVAIVLNLPERLCQERNLARSDRNFGDRNLSGHVVRQQHSRMRRSLRGLRKEGFRHVCVLRSPEEVEAVTIERVPLWNDRRQDHGPFDIVGDVHGCGDELESLLLLLGYEPSAIEGANPGWGSKTFRHPAGRKAVFVGDLVDRGPRVLDTLGIVRDMVTNDAALCVPGNHDEKLLRKLRGKAVQVTHGLEKTLAEIDALPEQARDAYRQELAEFLDDLVSHYVLDDGNLVVAHAGMKAEMQGRGSGKVRAFALYGETTGETDEFGLPVRFPWASEYRGSALVVYGHTPVPEPDWLNRTVNIDTGCVFGGKLTALRYPEMELVSVPAAAVYCEPTRRFLADDRRWSALSAQQAHDDVLDAEDVLGKRIVSTRLRKNITIREAHAAAALEVMSRFAINPKWLIYLPPTMSPCETTSEPGMLEHPAEALGYFRAQGVSRVILEEKHMGSRAVAIVCRDELAARERFGVLEGEIGAVYTRTGRRFFNEPALEAEFLNRARQALTAADLWTELDTNWVCLDCELMPWSAKAQELLKSQYAAVGAAGGASLPAAVRSLAEAAVGLAGEERAQLEQMLEEYRRRESRLGAFVAAYRRYCWSVASLADLKLAPFHLLASEGRVHTDRNHVWHMETLAKVAREAPDLILATAFKVLDVTDPEQVAEGIDCWTELTARGGEGMVVKPLEFVALGGRGLVQPAVKCRGEEYLRLIYGPDYTSDENLSRLRNRGLGHKRALAQSEFALGVEGLERFVRKEPLRRVHECVFGVLALESEPVDPRL